MRLDVMSEAAILDDAGLVELVLQGQREAFGQLVARYQSSVCAVLYSACGDLARSEDLAQETFIIAWRKLSDLKEPAKFKSWLYGIARNLVNNTVRRETRNPLAGADQLDESLPATHPGTNPAGQAISREEAGILWRSLEQIPENYREPLILFYREQQSIERVAAVLEVSEEAARQRLSRGRKLLHEQVIAFVEGTLQRTVPSQAFTLAVLTALPHLPAAGGATVLGGGALKGSTAGKAVISTGFLIFAKSLLLKFLPGVASTWVAAHALPESARERKFARRAWAGVWLLAILFPAVLSLGIYAGGKYWNAHPRTLTLALLGACFGFVAVLGPYTFWMSRVQKRLQREEAARSGNSRIISQSEPYEYRSARTLLGLPLVHIRFNCLKDGKILPAVGWVAFGTRAYGIILASGVTAVGLISAAPLAFGVVALGGFGVGGFAFGGFALGYLAMGGASIGYLAFGGGAIGWLGANGGATLARRFALGGGAIAEHANDQAAWVFMQNSFFFRHVQTVFTILILFSWLVPPALQLYFKRRRQRQTQPAPAI